jgi:hypothetical protein
MILRFQADADLNQIILHAVVRRAPAMDFQTSAAAGLAGVRDPKVLARQPAMGACSSLTIRKLCQDMLPCSSPRPQVQAC